ncbi:hypothetical protein EK904_002700 [Melospiza melodia maxima]|nr:hypothetical protein EK904_002700 [Melospiza melodia maxima]
MFTPKVQMYRLYTGFLSHVGSSTWFRRPQARESSRVGTDFSDQQAALHAAALPPAAASSRTQLPDVAHERELLTLTLLIGLHPTLVKGLRAPKGRSEHNFFPLKN